MNANATSADTLIAASALHRRAAQDAAPRALADCVARLVRAFDIPLPEQQCRALFKERFGEITSELQMYPRRGTRPSTTFEMLAQQGRSIAATCLPLAIALSMHWYPLCALHFAPLASFSWTAYKRNVWLARIRRDALIIANAGSARVEGSHKPVVAARSQQGVRLCGTYEYMSLASVADVVLMKVRRDDDGRELLCMADLKAPTVRIGSWRFAGSMRLSDTSSVTFDDHPLSTRCFVELPSGDAVRSLSDYQRAWFQLFISEIYLARSKHLCAAHQLSISADLKIELNEMAHLRAYCLHLLDTFDARPDAGRLLLATSTLKLGISRLTRSVGRALRQMAGERQDLGLQSDGCELAFIERQPTADAEILKSL